MKNIKIRITLTEEALGMTPSNPEDYEKFLQLRKLKLGKRAAELEGKFQAELEQMKLLIEKNKTESLESGTSVFFRNADGDPVFRDFQIRGAFKDWMRGLKDVLSKEDVAKKLAGKYITSVIGFKKLPAPWVDRGVFVGPKDILIKLPEGGEMSMCKRIIRKENQKAPGTFSTNFKISESVPAGSQFSFNLGILNDADENLCLACLHYGFVRGVGEWRNGAKGTFTFELYDESKKEWVYQEPELAEILGLDSEIPE